MEFMTMDLLNGMSEEEMEIRLIADNGYPIDETEDIIKDIRTMAQKIAFGS